MMNVGRVLSVLLLSSVAAQAVVDVFPYHESFETGIGEWSFDNSNAYRGWEWATGSSWYYYTGPAGAHDRDYYCYVYSWYSSSEASEYNMSATADLTALSEPTLSFYYHMFGSQMGALEVQVNTGGDWETIWARSGPQHTSADDPWTQAEVPLTQHISANTQIRFKGTVSPSTWRSDMAVDDIWIYDKPVLPARFEWTPIDERQFPETPFSVEVSAVDYKGDVLTSFNRAVELTAWSDGFGNACLNGDFEDGIFNNVWMPYAAAASPGEYTESASANGSAIALAFKPDEEYDGMSQVINVGGGETYLVTATYTPLNFGNNDVSGTFRAQILIKKDGEVEQTVDTVWVSTLYEDRIYSYTLSGSFSVDESEQEGTRTVSVVAQSLNGEDPNVWAYFDDVSVNFAPEQYLDVEPKITGDFVNGVWNGNITMNYRLPNIHLIARYVDVMGESGIFTTYVSAYDSDFDGMLDDWERLYFSSTEACEAGADPDGDGYSNGDEFMIGTHPTEGDSHLAFRARISGEKCILDWYANEACTYDVEWRPNMQSYSSFSTIAEDVPYTQASFTNDMSTYGFYRIKVHKK